MSKLPTFALNIERRAAYDVTEVAPIGGQLIVVTEGSAYTVLSNFDGKTVLLGPSATLAQLRTYCAAFDPVMAGFPVYPLEAEEEQTKQPPTVEHHDEPPRHHKPATPQRRR